MDINLFNFDLPKRLIAQSPAKPRDMAKLLVMNKQTGHLTDEVFFNLKNYLKAGDVLVFNNTKVFPARLVFDYQGKSAEILLVEQLEKLVWKAMIKPGKRFKIGSKLKVFGVEVEVTAIDKDGLRILKFDYLDENFGEFLKKYGQLPIPPYITEKNYQQDEYNTLYSREEKSIAAPTAGLHFSKELLMKLQSMGVILEFVTLEVGLGTFLPVKSNDSRMHKMHTERYWIDYGTAKRLTEYQNLGRRIVAVGTTTVRVLEDNFNKFEKIQAGEYLTNIFIKPGYNWKIVNGLITNFHLPKSTLLMLVSAFTQREKMFKAYNHAINKDYKFFSFGDAMLII